MAHRAPGTPLAPLFFDMIYKINMMSERAKSC